MQLNFATIVFNSNSRFLFHCVILHTSLKCSNETDLNSFHAVFAPLSLSIKIREILGANNAIHIYISKYYNMAKV
jgi:hypothetical protein